MPDPNADYVRVEYPTDPEAAHILKVSCPECSRSVNIASTAVDGASRWFEATLRCAVRPFGHPPVIIRWEAKAAQNDRSEVSGCHE
jgi:hypothetical protein